jgi:hypothetical protein
MEAVVHTIRGLSLLVTNALSLMSSIHAETSSCKQFLDVALSPVRLWLHSSMMYPIACGCLTIKQQMMLVIKAPSLSIAPDDTLSSLASLGLLCLPILTLSL